MNEIEKALYELIDSVSQESSRYVESKGKLIRLPAKARVDKIMALITKN